MNILITNDDGVSAQGIIALAKRLSIEHHVVVVAPDSEKSACSHSITLGRPLSAKRIELADYEGIEAYSVNGTPADCVKVATSALVRKKIDIVLSGINLGGNLGTDIAYSGTVNAALEGCICGYPSIAFSQRVAHRATEADVRYLFESSADLAAQIVSLVDFSALDGYIYNINFPNIERRYIKGMKVCEQGISAYDAVFQKQDDPFGREFYWLCATPSQPTYNEEHQTDVKWIAEGYITLTPLTWNDTYWTRMEETKCKINNLKLHF